MIRSLIVLSVACTSLELFNDEEALAIVEKLNEYRSIEFAMPPANMRDLTWNTQLVYSAAADVENCAYGNVSDQFTSYFDFNGSIDDPLGDFVQRALRTWGEEERDLVLLQVTPNINVELGIGVGVYSNFSQIVWAESYAVGCAYNLCNNVRVMQCRFENVGNVPGEPWFTYGALGSLCPNGTTADETVGFCHTIELPPNQTTFDNLVLTPGELNTKVAGGALTARALELNVVAVSSSKSSSAVFEFVAAVMIGLVVVVGVLILLHEVKEEEHDFLTYQDQTSTFEEYDLASDKSSLVFFLSDETMAKDERVSIEAKDQRVSIAISEETIEKSPAFQSVLSKWKSREKAKSKSPAVETSPKRQLNRNDSSLTIDFSDTSSINLSIMSETSQTEEQQVASVSATRVGRAANFFKSRFKF